MVGVAELFASQDRTARWRAESENASARLELAQIEERSNLLISIHQPVARMKLDRGHLEVALRYLRHGNIARLNDELRELEAKGDFVDQPSSPKL